MNGSHSGDACGQCHLPFGAGQPEAPAGAPDCSPRRKPWVSSDQRAEPRQGRKKPLVRHGFFCRPLRGWYGFPVVYPRLAPWAIACRPLRGLTVAHKLSGSDPGGRPPAGPLRPGINPPPAPPASRVLRVPSHTCNSGSGSARNTWRPTDPRCSIPPRSRWRSPGRAGPWPG